MPNINGLVLTGGKSTRMGKDKSLISYHGKPHREYLFELLKEFCSNVYTSCNAEQNVPDHLNPLVDQYQIGGPLNGILTGLAQGGESACIAIAVDMPNVDRATIKRLLDERDMTKVATCFITTQTNQLEPLLALWEYKAFSLIMDFVKTGNLSPKAFLELHPIKKIKADNSKIFLNINYPNEE